MKVAGSSLTPAAMSIQLLLWLILLQLGGAVATADLAAQTSAVEVNLKDQTSVTGRLVQCDIDSLVLQENDLPKRLSIESIASVKFVEASPVDITSSIQILLLDGSTLIASACELVGRGLAVQLGGGAEITPQKRNVRSIIFNRGGRVPTPSSQVTEVLNDPSITADTLIVFRKGEFNVIEGVVTRLTTEIVDFSIGDQSAEIALDKVSAITFFKAGVSGEQYSDPLATCELTNSSVLKLRRFSGNEDSVELITLVGDSFQLKPKYLRALSFETTTLVPLASLAPTTNDWEPLVTIELASDFLRRLRLAKLNRSYSGKQLELEVNRPSGEVAAGKTPTVLRTYPDGIAMRGGGRMAWQLGGDYQKLRGKIGFAPQASDRGQVVFRVVADGETILSLPVDNQNRAGPVDFEVELAGRRRMVFEIGYADNNSVGDIVHLVEVVLEK